MERNRLAIALLMTVVAACGPAPGALPSTTAGPATSADPTIAAGPATNAPSPVSSASGVSPSPSAAPTNSGVPFASDSIARVATDGLRMRSEPGVEASSTKLEPLLLTGMEVFVVDGPVRASDYDWYLVRPLPSTIATPPIGWVAAADKDGTPWLTPDLVPCPTASIATFAAMHGLRALSCYAGQVETFTARIGPDQTGICFEIEIPWSTRPGWLSTCGPLVFLIDLAAPLDGDSMWEVPKLRPSFEDGIDVPEIPQDYDYPERWLLVSVTGRFDHPAATSCRAVPAMPPDEMAGKPAPDPTLVVLDCRVRFAISAIDILGE